MHPEYFSTNRYLARPKLPLTLTVVLHLSIVSAAIFSPYLDLNLRKKPPEVHSVSLINLSDLPGIPGAPGEPASDSPPQLVSSPAKKAPEPEPAPMQAEPEQTPIPEPVREATPLPVPEPPAREAPPAVSEAPAQPISISPSSPVKKMVSEPPPTPASPEPARPLRTEADSQSLQQLRESLRLEAEIRQTSALAEEARRRALEAARANIAAQSEASRARQTAPASATEGQGGEGGGSSVDALTGEYLSRLHSHVQSRWSVPDLPSWDDNLLATMVIVVRRDGSLREASFERRSDNRMFNQLVERTVREAVPFPAFPAALRQNEIEVGLNFRPGEVF